MQWREGEERMSAAPSGFNGRPPWLGIMQHFRIRHPALTILSMTVWCGYTPLTAHEHSEIGQRYCIATRALIQPHSSIESSKIDVWTAWQKIAQLPIHQILEAIGALPFEITISERGSTARTWRPPWTKSRILRPKWPRRKRTKPHPSTWVN